MSDLDSIITLSISRNTSTPTQAGFGTPFLLTGDPEKNPKAGTEWGATRVRTYTSLSAVGTDFATTTNTYLMAAALFGQNPRPTSIKVGRRSTFVAQEITFIPTTSTIGHTIGVEINGTQYSRTLTASTTIATAIDEWITAHGAAVTALGLTPTDNITDISLVATTAGNAFRYGNPVNAEIEDTTAGTVGTDLTADLAACRSEDDDWYLLLIDTSSATEIAAVATVIEANNRLFLARTFDSDVAGVTVGSDGGSIAYTLQNGNFDRTALFYTQTGDLLDCAWAGNVLPEPAGSVTWAYRSLSGVGADSLSGTEITNLENKDVNFNTTIGGINITRYGTASGGEFLDVMRGSDWLGARIQERIYALLVNNDKVPFTDNGIQAIRGEILAQLQAGVGRNFLASDPEPTCTAPLAKDVSAVDKGLRHLDGVTFRATLAGAIHKTTIAGELNL